MRASRKTLHPTEIRFFTNPIFYLGGNGKTEGCCQSIIGFSVLKNDAQKSQKRSFWVKKRFLALFDWAFCLQENVYSTSPWVESLLTIERREQETIIVILSYYRRVQRTCPLTDSLLRRSCVARARVASVGATKAILTFSLDQIIYYTYIGTCILYKTCSG